MARSVRSRSTRRATCSPIGCSRSTGAAAPSLRPRVRRQPAAGARPRVPRRVRRRPGRAHVSAEAARGSAAARRGDARAARRRRSPSRTIARADERLLLRLAVGAADRAAVAVVSALDVAESRPRVPSFYALDVMRAITGRVPNHDELQERAAAAGGARLAWPAPARARSTRSTISSTISRSCASCCSTERRDGRQRPRALPARLNEALQRSVTAAGRAARSPWTPCDGITRVTGTTGRAAGVAAARRAPVLAVGAAAVRDAVRISSCCPRSIGCEPRGRARAAAELDPLTRGASSTRCRPSSTARCSDDGALPVTRARPAARARPRSTRSLARVAAEYDEQLAPAIERVWRDEIDDIARDLRIWVRRLPDDGDWHARATSSSASACPTRAAIRAACPSRSLVDGRFLLRGSVDLIEQQRRTARSCASPITRPARTGRRRKTVVGGGAMLQPVLYSLAVEQALGAAGRVGPAVLLHHRRRLRRSRDPAQRRQPRAPGSRCSRSSTARSSSASCRPRRPSAPARGATSGRCAARTRSSASRASRRSSSPISQALREMP